jgi:CRP/FNR family transcriptional regulator
MADSSMLDRVLVPFEQYLSEEEKEEVRNNSNTVEYNKREIIFRQNTRTSHIMFVNSGMVKIFKEGRNKKYIILKVAVPMDFLGLLSIYGKDTHEYSASAIQTAEVTFIDINTFNRILFNNGEFAERVIQKICNYGLFIFDRLMSQSHKQLPGRIADVILYFAENIYLTTLSKKCSCSNFKTFLLTSKFCKTC